MGDCHMVGPIVLLINHKSITQSLFITFSFEREQIDWDYSKGKGANCRTSLMQNGEAEKAHRCSPAQPVDKRRCKRFKGNIWRVNISLSETPYRPRLVACLMTNWISLVWSTKTEEPPTHIRLGFQMAYGTNYTLTHKLAHDNTVSNKWACTDPSHFGHQRLLANSERRQIQSDLLIYYWLVDRIINL